MSQAIVVQQIQNIAPSDSKASVINQTEKLVILLEEDLDPEEKKMISDLCGLRYSFVDTPTLDIAEYFKLYDIISFYVHPNVTWWTNQITYLKQHVGIVSCFRRTRGSHLTQEEIKTKTENYKVNSVRKHLPTSDSPSDYISKCKSSHLPRDETKLSWLQIFVKILKHIIGKF